ncbi:MAG: ABC transporter permease [Angustibacter sp.]
MSATSVQELSEAEASAHDVVQVAVARRRSVLGVVLLVVGSVVVLAFGLGQGDGERAAFRLSGSQDAAVALVVDVPAGPTTIALGILVVALGALVVARPVGRVLSRAVVVLASSAAVLGFLCWACTGTAGTVLDLTGLGTNTVLLAVPLVLGALAGIVSERSGVINVAIEGQMLAGAFLAAVVASASGSLLAGAFGGAGVGAVVGGVLAVFAIRYLVNQVVLGVVINLLVLGLTGFLYSQLLQTNAQDLNSPAVFAPIPIPLLSDIPVLGPLLFRGNLLVYATYALLVAVQVALFRTRWGLRTRAVGEHPRAADTLGINVNRLRRRNCLVAGAIAGLAGAYISIGSVGAFSGNMTAGRGFIALAAVIFGRWSPVGALGAALLFAFCSALQTVLSIIGTPVEVPSQFLAMLPYVATIVVVAGVVGRVHAPAADGVPYVKQ